MRMTSLNEGSLCHSQSHMQAKSVRQQTKKKQLFGVSPQANYTNRAPPLVDEVSANF
jgi:hypothetical protein